MASAGRLPHQRRSAPFTTARRDAIRRILLAAGPLSSLLYVVFTDVLAASRWDGYRRISIGAFLLWVVVLAIALWKPPAKDRVPGSKEMKP